MLYNKHVNCEERKWWSSWTPFLGAAIGSLLYCFHNAIYVWLHFTDISIYIYIYNTIKDYKVQVKNLYTDASDSQDNHTEVDNIIQMEMTPKITTIRYIIKREKTLATLKFSTSAYRVVVSTEHIRLNTWPSNYLFTP